MRTTTRLFTLSLAGLLAGLLISVFGPLNSFAQDCKLKSSAKVINSISASAGNWANLRNNPGSLRFESDRLLKEGYSLLTSANTAQKIPALVLESTPQKFLTDYRDSAYCQEKFSSTVKKPIEFNGLSFASIDELSKWFGDFSQGSGKEGKQLYALCDKSCSPQYSLQIKESAGKLNVNASAICGPARDKDDDMYLLCTGAAS